MLIPIAREAFLPLLLLSLVAGLFFGAIYDLFRIRRVAFRLPREEESSTNGLRRLFRRNLARTDTLLCFAEDLLFCLFGTVVLILMNFKLYYGVPRWYAFGATVLGFWIYRITLGRLVIRSAETVIGWIGAFAGFIRNRIVMPALRQIKGWLHAWHRKTISKRELAYTKAEEARMLAVFADGMTKGNNNGKETEKKHEKDGSF